jgi:hypothetical protein
MVTVGVRIKFPTLLLIQIHGDGGVGGVHTAAWTTDTGEVVAISVELAGTRLVFPDDHDVLDDTEKGVRKERPSEDVIGRDVDPATV